MLCRNGLISCIGLVFALNAQAQSSNDTTHRLRVHNDNKPLFNIKVKPEKIDLKTLPADYYTQHMAFFCRQELRIEKLTTVPVLFRVGNVSDCNFLEQKPGYQLR